MREPFHLSSFSLAQISRQDRDKERKGKKKKARHFYDLLLRCAVRVMDREKGRKKGKKKKKEM